MNENSFMRVDDVARELGISKSYACIILGKRSFKGFSCVGGYQPTSVVSVVLISMYSAIRRNSSANLK